MRMTDCDMTKPFTHPEMIGAYCIVDGKSWVHRDCVDDFKNMEYIRNVCLGFYETWGLCADDLLRNDWRNVEFTA